MGFSPAGQAYARRVVGGRECCGPARGKHGQVWASAHAALFHGNLCSTVVADDLGGHSAKRFLHGGMARGRCGH